MWVMKMVKEKQEIKAGDKTVQLILTDSARDSITLKKDSKGNYSYEIKVYDFEAESIVDRIFNIAIEMDERIKSLKG